MKLNSINPERFGAVVVDMQPGFLGNISSDDKEKLFASQIETLEICVKRGYPITVLEYFGEGQTDKRIKNIIEKASKYEFFEKGCNDGFNKIYNQIEKWGLDELCFMGISAAYCVKATASSAIKNKKKILTARELIASQTYRQKEFRECIPWFQKNGTYFPQYTELIDVIAP